MHLSRKHKVALGATLIPALLAGAAFAYYTSTGSGTGSATAGTSTAVVLHGTVADTLYPGTSSSVSFTVDNPSNGHQYVNVITLASVTTDVAHAACVVADFSMPNVTAAQDVASGNGTAIIATGTITMANTSTSQDACRNAPLTLNLTSN